MRLSGDDPFDRLMGGYSRPVVELRTEYHRQLGEIDAAVMRMFTVGEEDIGATAAAFLHGDDMAAATVAGHDEVIEGLYAKIEDLVHAQLVRQAPVAGELEVSADGVPHPARADPHPCPGRGRQPAWRNRARRGAPAAGHWPDRTAAGRRGKDVASGDTGLSRGLRRDRRRHRGRRRARRAARQS